MRAIFIGDETTAAGFRLSGMETLTPGEDEAGAVYREARERADLLVLSAETARAISQAIVEADMARPRPLLLVVPDVRDAAQPTDFAERIRAHLGVREDIVSSD